MDREGIIEDSTDVWTKNLIQRYEERPPSLEQVYLAEFVAWYANANDFVDNEDDVRLDDSDNSEAPPETRTLRAPQEYRRRLLGRVILYKRYDIDETINYKREMVLLYVQFRNKMSEIVDQNKFLQLFENNKYTIMERRSLFEKNLNIENGMRELEAMMILQNEGNINLPEEESRTAFVQQLLVEDGVENVDDVNQIVPRQGFSIVKKRSDVTTKQQYCELVRTTNPEQRETIVEIIHRLHGCGDEIQEALQIFFTGPAGCGKTYTLKCLMETYNRYTQEHNSMNNAYIACASTGKAAVPLGGPTVHSKFRLTTSRVTKLLPTENLQAYSYVSVGITGIYGRPFAGIRVVRCGDFRQLPPVRASPCYRMPINQLGGPILWHSIDYFPLVWIVRQTDERFSTILTEIGDGLKLSNDKIELIEYRHISESWCKENVPDAVRLYYSNTEVDAYNRSAITNAYNCLAQNIMLGYSSEQEKTQNRGKLHKMSVAETDGLPYLRPLAEGFPYMITSNIDVADGTILPASRKEIITLWLEFPEATTGANAKIKCRPRVQSKPNTLFPNWVPVYKKVVNITLTKTVKCKRKQFPCVPACATIIHKAQGGTFEVIVYKYSSKQPQQLVSVAMSRVTSLDGLYIITDKDAPFIFKHGRDGNDSQAARDIRNEYRRLRGHELQTITKKAVKFCDDANTAGQTIVTNLNSQSLHAHFADIETDAVIPRSDYLLLTETWMHNSCDPVSINNYECVSRLNNRSDSDTNAAGGVAIYRQLSSTSTARVVEVALTDASRLIKNTASTCHRSYKWDPDVPILLCGDFNTNVKTDDKFLKFMKDIATVRKRTWSESSASLRTRHVKLAPDDSLQTPLSRSPVPSRTPSPQPTTSSSSPPLFECPRTVKRHVPCSSVVYRRCENPAPEIPTCSWMSEYVVPDLHQPRNQAQVDSEWMVTRDVEEHASSTDKSLKELEVDNFGEARETSEIIYVIEMVPTEDDTNSQVLSNLAAPVTVSADLPASTRQVVTSADVHVSAGEDMPSSRSFRVSSPTEALLDPESGSDSEYSDEGGAEYCVTSAKKKIQLDVSDDEELPSKVAASLRVMEAAMDADHEKLLSGDVNFKWQQDFTAFTAVREEFLVHPVGAVKDYDSPYDAFVDIFDEGIMKEIVVETNRYAHRVIDEAKTAGIHTTSSRMYRWKDTTVDELYRLFAVFIYMGICQFNSLEEYWRKGTDVELVYFRNLMSYDRYILLTKCLHFSDNDKQPLPNAKSKLPLADSKRLPADNQEESVGSFSHRLYKLQPVISHLNRKFQELYVLDRWISVDESLTLFKGGLSFAQFIKAKAARWGIKSFELCESRTGYLHKFIIYTGEEKENINEEIDDDCDERAESGRGRARSRGHKRRHKSKTQVSNPPATSGFALNPNSMGKAVVGKTTQIVLNLLEGLEHKGHCVIMDNFYNSPALARYLKCRGFDCLGPVRRTRKNMPDDVKEMKKNCDKGTIIARHSGDVTVLAWKDAKIVSMISTFHDNSTYTGTRAGEECEKPSCVKDYKTTMGGVDLKEQKLSMYPKERERGIKWYIKMFKRLLNTSVHNAYILYKDSHSKTSDENNIMTHREFRYQIAASLKMRHTPPAPVRSLTSRPDLRLDRTKNHMPIRGNILSCRMCSLKYDIRSRTVIQCSVCKVGLCVLKDDCFLEYHSVETLPPGRLKRDKSRRGHGPGRRNRRNELTEPTPSTSKG
ncbi:PiggyBac transposable element-derived protein 4 [Eumeta japonica]|uniref:ATP-dependent DNA helicase n=1 Tax=Eumeta variegata TaxID=151549 RepID=A0A4C1Y7H6_EUMVA|nr:PiggyBac transposable element-derived protein 4 [Eumeta japonica]